MRIAIYHNLPSGGAKRTLYESTRRLSKNHKIDVFSLSTAERDFADIRPFADHHQVFDFKPLPLLRSPLGRLNQLSRLRDLLYLDRLNEKIARQIDSKGYDVLVVHPCQFEKCPSVLYYSTIPTVYYCHESLRRFYEEVPARPYDNQEASHRSLLNKVDPLPKLYQNKLRQIDRRNMESAGMVLVNSEFTRRAINHIYDVDAQVSYHGVDTEWFRPLPIAKEPSIFSAGSLTPMKGFDFLVRSVSAIPVEKRPPLLIASNFQNPPERDYLTTLAAELDVDLKLLGNVSDDCLLEMYNQSMVVVYAPVREPFGLVPLEAMACGTAVIGVREGGIQETIRHRQTGLLVERDTKQFATAILEVMGEGVAANYGRCGREYVLQNWTWDKAVKTLEGYLERSMVEGKKDEQVI